MNCVALSPQGLDLSISLPLGFFALNTNLCILNALLGFMPFMESFVTKPFQKDFNTITNLPMFIDPQIAFVMSSFWYVIHLSYLLFTIFLSLGILQHYAKFELCTMIKLKNIFDR
jgi:hypothetical protein